MAEPRLFAAFLDLRERAVVVVGGGAVAERKVRALVRAGARVTLVTPELCAALRTCVADGIAAHRMKRFEARDLEGAALAIAATDDRDVNAAVARAARERGIEVNVADDPAASTFIMPSVVERGPIQVAVTTSGASPVLAARIGELVAEALPEAYGRLATLAAEYRPVVQARIADGQARRAFWHRIFEGPVAARVLDGRDEEARALLEADLARSGSPDTP